MTKSLKFFLAGLLLLGVAAGSFLLLRGKWVQQKLDALVLRAEQKEGWELSYQDWKWTGWSSLEIQGLSFTHPSGQIKIARLELSYTLAEILTGKKIPQKLALNGANWTYQSPAGRQKGHFHLSPLTDQTWHLTASLDPGKLQHPALGPTSLDSGPYEMECDLHFLPSSLRAEGKIQAPGNNHYPYNIQLDWLSGTFHSELRTSPQQGWEQFRKSGPEGFFPPLPLLEGDFFAALRLSGRWGRAESLDFDLDWQGDSLQATPSVKKLFARLPQIRGSLPHWTELEQVPDLLQKALILAEDANFYEHSGFDQEILRHSLIENYQEGRFVRGGSTLSMQLVRNLFLSKDKNLPRKWEEILLTWIMERDSLLSKKEMLTWYLNWVEWGPGIHGLGPAAQYYFGKSVQNLQADEALFLALILPNPRYWFTLFRADGRLEPFAEVNFRSLQFLLAAEDALPWDATAAEILIPLRAERVKELQAHAKSPDS